MIAWKAQWGYLPDSYSSPAYPAGTNNVCNARTIDFSYMTITDDSWFPVLTSLDLTKLPINKSQAEMAAVELADAMGNLDYAMINVIPHDQDYSDQLLRFVPSMCRQCPNLYALQVKPNIHPHVFVLIPGLDRVIVYGSWGSRLGSCGIFQYTTGQNVLISSYTVEGFYTKYENSVQLPVCYKYDGTEESLKNGRNYTLLKIEFASNPLFTAKNNGQQWTELNQTVPALFGAYSPPDYVVPTNPYEPIDPSGPTDPDNPPGTFDDESDPIPDSPIPTLSSANTGFTRIYNPTLSQVQQLANYLWTDESVVQTIWNHIKQYFEDPMQAIIGFNLVPVPVPDGGTEEFKLMYIGTGVNMTVAASQFVDVDCGTLEVQPYYGSYLDYAPYTKISCFLPYIGNVEINPDEVMGTTIQVKYRVDICAGSCVAKILVDNNCLYQYSGHCAINIPFSSADFSTYVSAAISVAKLGVGVATAGALGSAGLEAGEIAQATSAVTTTKTERNPATGRQITSGTTTVTRESTRELKPSPASYAGLTPKNVSNTVGEVMGSKPGFQHSGSFSGNTGYLGVRRPFLIITRPNLCLPESYQAMNGFPAMITMKLSECTGFTQVQQVQFSGSSATNPEQDEILQFLKSGVVF